MRIDTSKPSSSTRQAGMAAFDTCAPAELSGAEPMSDADRRRADEGKTAAGRCTCLLCETAHRARRRLGI